MMVGNTGDVLRLRPGALEWRAFEGEVLALDLDRGQYLLLNRTGAFVWQRLVDGARRPDLARVLAERFGIDPAAAVRDVDAFVAVLRERDLLEP